MRRSITSAAKVKEKFTVPIQVEDMDDGSEEEKLSSNLLNGFFAKKNYVPMNKQKSYIS